MSWKNLWKDARIACEEGQHQRAHKLFALTLIEAKHCLEEGDPELQSLVAEMNDFYQVHGSEDQTLHKLDDVAREQPALSDLSPAPANAGEYTVWQVCNQCGATSHKCKCGNATATAPPSQSKKSSGFETGDLIARRYQIIRELGSGGMAVVFLVRHVVKDDLFAMKILNKEFTDDHEANERFEREAQAIRKLRHPSLVTIHDFGRTSDGRSYFVLDFLKGESLFTVLERETRLSTHRTCGIFLQICDAMAHAHKGGIIHRDLKPSNIVLLNENNKTDQVRIVDFGIAKINQTWAVQDLRLTQEGRVFGSPAYMSPEQCLGNEADARSDIYSIGCMMYQCLCGEPPFSAEYPLAVLYKQVNEAPPTLAVHRDAPSRTSLELEKIVMKALRKDPNERYQSMVALEKELLDFAIKHDALPQGTGPPMRQSISQSDRKQVEG